MCFPRPPPPFPSFFPPPVLVVLFSSYLHFSYHVLQWKPPLQIRCCKICSPAFQKMGLAYFPGYLLFYNFDVQGKHRFNCAWMGGQHAQNSYIRIWELVFLRLSYSTDWVDHRLIYVPDEEPTLDVYRY